MTTANRRVLGAVLALGLNATLLAAGYPLDRPHRHLVDFADVDLGSERGIAVLYSRIKTAAEEVCEPIDAREALSAQLAQRCTGEAIERAVATIDVPALTSYLASRQPQHPGR
jgi:UrcA family protein